MYNVETDMTDLAALHQNQQLRIKALDLIKSLFELVRVVQQHRAATNAALAGNPFFESKTRVLAREINSRFKEAERQQETCLQVVDSRQWQDIRDAWQTVHLQWRQDEIIENFELHSHLVKELLIYISILGNKAECLIETGSHHQALSHYVLTDIPSFIELLGQIRALGTSTAVVGIMDDACEMRLRFLMSQLQKQQIKVKQQAQQLSQEALDITSSLIDALLCEPKLERLTGIVMHDLLSGREIVTSADEIFTLSTQIIDAHYNVMNEGLRLLRLSMDRRMQAWVSR